MSNTKQITLRFNVNHKIKTIIKDFKNGAFDDDGGYYVSLYSKLKLNEFSKTELSMIPKGLLLQLDELKMIKNAMKKLKLRDAVFSIIITYDEFANAANYPTMEIIPPSKDNIKANVESTAFCFERAIYKKSQNEGYFNLFIDKKGLNKIKKAIASSPYDDYYIPLVLFKNYSNIKQSLIYTGFTITSDVIQVIENHISENGQCQLSVIITSPNGQFNVTVQNSLKKSHYFTSENIEDECFLVDLNELIKTIESIQQIP